MRRDSETVAGQRDSRREVFGERELRVVTGEINEARRQAGNARRERSVQRALRRDLALGIEKHGGRGGTGRGLACIDHGFVAIARVMHQEKTAAADAGAIGFDHRQRCGDRNRCVKGVTASVEYGVAGGGRKRVGAGDGILARRRIACGRRER